MCVCVCVCVFVCVCVCVCACTYTCGYMCVTWYLHPPSGDLYQNTLIKHTYIKCSLCVHNFQCISLEAVPPALIIRTCLLQHCCVL